MVQLNIGGLVLGSKPVIKSIQYGSVTVDAATGTAAINAVDTDNSVVMYLGYTDSGDITDGDGYTYVELTDSTTVTGTRDGTGDVVTVNFVVIEFASGILKSRQVGLITITSKSNTATIDAVDTNKAVIFWQGFKADDHDIDETVLITLTNSTTVTASTDSSLNDATIPYTVMEFF